MAHVPRLFVPGPLAPGPRTLDAGQARRLASVMRVRPGDELHLFAADGREWRAEVTRAERGSVTAAVLELVRQEPQPARLVELWIAVVRANRLDWAIEKAVEAGASVIRPMTTEHTARGDASTARVDRWQRISIEATEQSGRLYLTPIEAPTSFATLLAHPPGPLIVAHPEGQSWSQVAHLLPPAGRIAVAVGPEGGFSADEIARARARGALIATLGPHILRTETAAVVATALANAT